MKINAYAIKQIDGEAEPFLYERTLDASEVLVRITYCGIATGDIQFIRNIKLTFSVTSPQSYTAGRWRSLPMDSVEYLRRIDYSNFIVATDEVLTVTGRVTIFNDKLIEKTAALKIESAIQSNDNFAKCLKDKFGIVIR